MNDNRQLILDMVHHNPGENKFNSQFLDPQFLQRFGYNGQVMSNHVQAAVLLEDSGMHIPAPSPAEKQWADKYASEIDTSIKHAKEAGLLCLAWTDFIVLPRRIFDSLGETITTTCPSRHEYDIKGAITPDIESPVLRKLIKKQIDEIFARFPELDGLVVRVGETYLHDLPHHAGGDPITNGTDSHISLIKLLRDAICEKHGKLLLYRTWLSGIDEDRNAYLKVSNQIEPHQNLIFSIKHCIGDFHRAHPFSPPLGFGEHRQIVEVQCQREYEGKGAYPNYIGGGVINGFPEYDYITSQTEFRGLNNICSSQNYAGIWTWSRGGGWQGPYIKDEFWCTMNASVLVKHALTNRSASDCLAEFFSESGFDKDDTARLVQIAEKSADAVLHGTASIRGGINTLWTRDCFIGGVEDPNEPMAKAVADVIAAGRSVEIISERRTAVKLWHEIVSITADIQSGPKKLREFISASASYGLHCYSVFEASWTLLLLDAEAAKSGNRNLIEMEAALQRYDQAWDDWLKLAETNPLCSTLYQPNYCRYVRDQGMVPHTGIGDSVERIRKTITNQKQQSDFVA